MTWNFSNYIPGVCSTFVHLTRAATDLSIRPGKTDTLDQPLTLASLETSVVAHRAEELKNEDGHSYHGQAHDKHHHPHRWTVGLYAGKQKKI